ncbi:MAG: RNA polymerase sigma factor [Acidobacteriota bacterium]
MTAIALSEDVAHLAALARKLCGNGPDADDLVQDTLERALRASPSYTEQGKRLGWLARILRNRFIDAQRAARAPASEDVDDLPAPEPEPVAAPCWDRLTPAHLTAAVAQLDEPFRRVYELHLAGWSYAQIAGELALPVNTVGTRLVRARGKLKQILSREL